MFNGGEADKERGGGLADHEFGAAVRSWNVWKF